MSDKPPADAAGMVLAMINVSKREATSTAYCIGVELEDFKVIEWADDEARAQDTETLGERLEEIDGVFRVEHNGHFGANLFLHVEKEADAEAKWREIGEAIDCWCAENVSSSDAGMKET